LAIGYAVTVRGEIDLRTVGPTEISAMVNWLVAGDVVAHQDRVLARRDTTDAQILVWFDERAPTYHAKLAKIQVSVLDYVA